MIIGRGLNGDGSQSLIIGLSHENIRRLLAGDPIVTKRAIHGDAVPEGRHILIAAGQTEQTLKEELVKLGLLDPKAEITRGPRLPPNWPKSER